MSFSTYVNETRNNIKNYIHCIEALPPENRTQRQELFHQLKVHLLIHDKIEKKLMQDSAEFDEAYRIIKVLAQSSLEPEAWQKAFEEFKQVVLFILLQISQQCVVSFKWH